MDRVVVALMGALVAVIVAFPGACLDPVPQASHVASISAAAACTCSSDACRSRATTDGLRISDAVDAFDVQLDEACLQARVQAHDSANCRPVIDDDTTHCGYRCRLLSGQRTVRRRCTALTSGGSALSPGARLHRRSLCRPLRRVRGRPRPQ